MTHQKPLICTILAALAASAVAQTLLELAKLIIDRIRTILGLDPPIRSHHPGIIFDCATSFIIGFIITRLRQTAHSDAKSPADEAKQMFESQSEPVPTAPTPDHDHQPTTPPPKTL